MFQYVMVDEIRNRNGFCVKVCSYMKHAICVILVALALFGAQPVSAQVEEARKAAERSVNKGAKAALAGRWQDACEHYARATALGGTEPYKRFFDGVVLILSGQQVHDCLIRARRNAR